MVLSYPKGRLAATVPRPHDTGGNTRLRSAEAPRLTLQAQNCSALCVVLLAHIVLEENQINLHTNPRDPCRTGTRG